MVRFSHNVLEGEVMSRKSLTETKTDPELLALLEKAKHHKMTPEERCAQRRAWVAGNIALIQDITMEEAFRRYDEAMARE